jgi:hypothetical protein
MNDKWLPAVIVAALLIAMGYALHADLQQPIPSALQAGRPPQTETNKARIPRIKWRFLVAWPRI